MKKLILVLFTFSIIFGFACRVGFCAYSPVDGDIKAEDLPENEFDSVGHCVKGAFCKKLRGNWSSIDIQNPYDNISYLYVIKRPYTSGNYSATYSIFGKRSNSSIPLSYKDVSISNSDISSDSDFAQVIDDALDNASVRTINDDYSNSTDVWANGGWFVTNIPMFLYGDDVGLQNYIDNGDLSGCVNRDDVINPYDSTIPMPQNLGISDQGKNAVNRNTFSAPVTAEWYTEPNVDYIDVTSLKYECEWRVSTIFSAGVGLNLPNSLKTYADTYGSEWTSPYVELSNNFYSEQSVQRLIDQYQLNNSINSMFTTSHSATDFGLDVSVVFNAYTYIKSITFRVRNLNSDGQYSDWRVYTYDYITKTETKSITNNENTTEESTEVPYDPYNPNNYNDNGSGNGSGNSSNNFSFNGTIKNDFPKFDLWGKLNSIFTKDSTMKNAINNSFNNVTDNLTFTGILAQTMPFIGNEYWELITLAMSMGVGLSGVRCIYRFLRG